MTVTNAKSFVPYDVKQLVRQSPTSMLIGASFLVLAVFCLVGLVADSRVVTGAPVWLKPLKFAISSALYAFTFPWFLQHLEGHARFRRIAEPLVGVILFIEVALITVQAARGVQSHFNISTTLDAAIFDIMGSSIALLWVLQIWTAILLLRQRFADPVVASSLRLALLLTVCGSGVGWFMTTPTRAQFEGFRHGVVMRAGSHTVGAPDGGPGLPLTGWSTEHGDLRVPHFVGLHALQLLPLFGLLISRTRMSARRRQRLVRLAGASYFALFAFLLIEALAGVPLASTATLVGLGLWAIVTLGALLAVTSGSSPAAVEAA
jgi:hypothetical protein